MEITGMNFGQAIEMLKDGRRVRREKWIGGRWVMLSCRNSTHTVPPALLLWSTATFLPWCPTCCDILAEDWETYGG